MPIIGNKDLNAPETPLRILKKPFSPVAPPLKPVRMLVIPDSPPPARFILFATVAAAWDAARAWVIEIKPNTCLYVSNHIKNCPICSKFYENDKSIYIIIIIILAIVCIILARKVLENYEK